MRGKHLHCNPNKISIDFELGTEQNAEVETPQPSDLQMSLRRTAEAVVEHGKEFVQSIHDVISELPLVSTFATAF